jgi:hypothetical protein
MAGVKTAVNRGVVLATLSWCCVVSSAGAREGRHTLTTFDVLETPPPAKNRNPMQRRRRLPIAGADISSISAI